MQAADGLDAADGLIGMVVLAHARARYIYMKLITFVIFIVIL